MNKNLKRLLAGTGIVAGTVATAGIISYKITKKLVSIALDRSEEETVIDHDNGKEPESPEMQHFRMEREWSYVKKKYKLNMPFLRLAYPAKASAFSSNAA